MKYAATDADVIKENWGTDEEMMEFFHPTQSDELDNNVEEEKKKYVTFQQLFYFSVHDVD